MSDNYD